MHLASDSFCRSFYEIDLSKLENNISNLAELVHPAKIAVAVKADAYGHGLIPISKKLDEIGIEFLCVATADEAIELRDNEINAGILLLSEPPRSAIDDLIDRKVTFSVYSKEFLHALVKTDKKTNVHLKVNTGMNRVGCRVEDVAETVEDILQSPNLNFEGIYTHFPSADEEVKEPTLMQLKSFQYQLGELDKKGIEPHYIHAANSAAAISVPESRYNLVRVGLSGYGYYPSTNMRGLVNLSPIAKLTSEISFTHKAKLGETVSYSMKYVCAKDANIAVIPIGYGDGVPRNLGLKGSDVLIEGKLYPIVGAVTMDQLMVDVSDKEFEVGTKVVLIGKDGGHEITADDWANTMGTISYEILCSIGSRVTRNYV